MSRRDLLLAFQAILVRCASISFVTAIGCLTSASAADFFVADRQGAMELVSRIQATQFLTHATFGAAETEIEQLASEMRERGTIAAASAWIDRQTSPIETPPSLHLRQQELCIATDIPLWSINTGGAVNSSHAPNPSRYRQFAWWHHAMAGRDQLRQKTAWALSQIFSVGSAEAFDTQDFEATVPGGPIQKNRFLGPASFYDIFVQEAFTSYREVLGKVTYHAVMGSWLSYVGNQRAQNGIYPDENFAREVMQLFTIGLYLLNDDGTHRSGTPTEVATYDTDDVREYAKVFTGLGYGFGLYAPGALGTNPYSPYTSSASNDLNAEIKYQVPMRMAAFQHDRSTKNLLNGQTLINPAGPDAEHTERSANAEIDAALDGLVSHPNCPPFIVRRLIQRLVKSNPSKAYLTRMVAVFKNNGQGKRGDLRAVIKGILLDPEAWQPVRIHFARNSQDRITVTTMGTEDSRLQEPILNYIRFSRFFRAVSRYERSTGGSFTNALRLSQDFRLQSRTEEFEQSPFEAPSVFNFYLPDFQPFGDLQNFVPSMRIPNAIAFAPEFQIVNPLTSNRTANFFRDCVVEQKRIEPYLTRNNTSTNSQGVVTTSLESTRTVVTYNFATERDLLANEEGIDQLLERLDLYLCGGTLHTRYRNVIRSLILDEWYQAVDQELTEEAMLHMAKGAILAVVTSPSYLVTE